MNADIVTKSIILNRNLNKFLLLQRENQDSVGANTWENAGGNVECGEELEEAMRREIKEETGITDISIKRVAYVTLVNGKKPYLIIAYFCETVTEAITLSDEHQAFIWADEKECKKLLPKEIIADFERNKIFEYLEVS
ncbi:MAG: NUDIX domain-containing protein [Tissierellaceae bacterium]|jgi:8-oxo-dGTP diphosphatase|nr:NUDIX domain-containing protein [Tissierellaceae bacterium]